MDGKIENENAAEGLYYWVMDLRTINGSTQRKSGYIQLMR